MINKHRAKNVADTPMTDILKDRHSSLPQGQAVVEILIRKGIRHAVISSGSRNAPLTIGFSRSGIKCYSVIDERSAAFFALGMAKETGRPVALVCTSGSAVLNYYPAVAEAYYSRIPLIVISADRPAEIIDQGAGQTIRQHGVLSAHTAYSTSLREGTDEKTLRYNAREINTAFDKAVAESAPVHINVPFSEPLYGTSSVTAFGDYQEIETLPVENTLSQRAKDEISRIWNDAEKRMILVGVHKPDKRLESLLMSISRQSGAAVLSETTSNLHGECFVEKIDQAIIPSGQDTLRELAPELLITAGGMVVSKKIKAILSSMSPKYHIHVNMYDFPDTFGCLTHKAQVSDCVFFSHIASLESENTGYSGKWDGIKAERDVKHREYLSHVPFSDLKVWEMLTSHIPENTTLEISNSASIRYSQLFSLPSGISVSCNRGTSGIDGCTSTAAGVAAASQNPVTLITGDLSFMYDNNALWNGYLPSSFRMIVINNHGGGIFRILDGSRKADECGRFLEARHGLSVKYLAEMHSIEYAMANDEKNLKETLATFWDESQKARILEVFTPADINGDILRGYFEYLK